MHRSLLLSVSSSQPRKQQLRIKRRLKYGSKSAVGLDSHEEARKTIKK
jgi:hypothetical protein